MNNHEPLTIDTFQRGLTALSRRDPGLRRILGIFGPPPMWTRRPGFSTLLRIILEQQVSLASAKAAYEKLLAAAAPLTAERFMELDDAALRAVGFSRQKTAYGRNLARALLSGSLDLDRLTGLDDSAARDELIKVKGIGRWTADIYLLMALRRPDVWPAGDRALAVAARQTLGLERVPTTEELDAMGAAWKPWRAIAARLFWHYYLSGGIRNPRELPTAADAQ